MVTLYCTFNAISKFRHFVLLISTFRFTCTVLNTSVFCRSLMSCFPGALLRYFLNDSEIALVVPFITGITFVFTFHMHCIYIVRLGKVATSINRQVPFPLSWTVLSSLLLGMILSVFTC